MSQFWTYFPHTPDNTFLGTVVEEREFVHRARRSNKGLIYGKEGRVIGLEFFAKVTSQGFDGMNGSAADCFLLCGDSLKKEEAPVIQPSQTCSLSMCTR